MKTQLLEDIGQSTPLPPTPPAKAGHPTTNAAAQELSPGSSAPSASEPPQPAQPAAPPDLDSVFEEIAALEAQYVAPAETHEPVLAPTESARPPSPETPPAEPAMATAASAHAPDPAQGTTVPRGPVFDFTLPLPEPQAGAPLTPPPAWSTPSRRPRQRTLLWGTGLLAAALLVAGGWWIYVEHNIAGSLALVADGAKETLPVHKAAEPPATASQPAQAARGTPAVPPLVMLEPESPAPARAETPVPAATPPEQAAPETASTPEPDAQSTSAFPLPKSLSRAAHGQSNGAQKPAPRKVTSQSERHIARASSVQAEKPRAEEGAMTALLRACREHGYHAAQCVKQGCSLTQYGFACRGR